MTESQIVILFLVGANACAYGLLGYTLWIFMREVQKLVDKLMSRDYHSYAQSQNKPEPRPKIVVEPPMENFDRIIG